MSKQNITIKTLFNAKRLINKIDLTKKDKLTYAAKRWLERHDEVYPDEHAKVEALINEQRTLLASVDDHKDLIVNENGTYKYTPEKVVELDNYIAKQNKDFNAKSIPFEPYTFNIDNDEFSRVKEIFDEFELEKLEGIFWIKGDESKTKK